jgi:hypothetical protein
LLILERFKISRVREQLAVAASLALFTSLGFFAGTVMPDIFAGLALAALGMLLAFGGRLGGLERAFWIFTLVFACAAHNAILLAAGLSLVVVTFLTWRQRSAGGMIAAAGLLVAFVAGVIAKPVFERAAGVEVVSVPFLLARSIGDGPGARLLTEDCPGAGYVSCGFVPHFPLTEGEVLWTKPLLTRPGAEKFASWARLPPAERRAISAEANGIVLKAAMRYPVEQVSATLGNIARQLVDLNVVKFGWTNIRVKSYEATTGKIFASEGERYKATRIWAGTFPLKFVSGLWLAVYLAAAGAIVIMLAIARQRRVKIDDATRIFVTTVITGVLMNAAISATFSATVGRYQSRLSWLVLLSAILIGHAMARARVTAPPEPRVLPI